MKAHGYTPPQSNFKPIHMPRNTGAGIVLAGISTLLGFALVWHIWWLAIVALIAVIAAAILHTFTYDRDFDIPSAEVRSVELARAQAMNRMVETP